MTNSIVFVLKCALVVCCLLLVCGCSPAKIDEANGRVIFIEANTQSYWPGTGILSAVQPINPSNTHPLCNGKGDTILVKRERKDLFPDSEEYHICAYNVVQDELTGNGSLKLTNPPYWAMMVQHLEPEGHYLVTGTRDGDPGIFEFNQDWEPTRGLTSSELFPLEEATISRAFALKSGKLIVELGGLDIYTTSWITTNTYCLGEGRLHNVSADARFVCFSRCSMKYSDISEYDSRTNEIHLIERTSDLVLHARYSPDGRFIAYSKRLYWLLDTVFLYIYDRESGSITNTWVSCKDDFLWTAN